MKEDEDEEVWTPVATLDHDGKIAGLIVPKDQRRTEESWQVADPEKPLELDHKPPYQPPQDESPPKRHLGAGPAVAIGLFVLLAAGGIIALATRGRSPLARLAPPPDNTVDSPNEADDGTPSGPRNASLTIESDPPGASVFINGEDMGHTPLLGSNDFAKGMQVEVRVERSGYRTWTGSIEGGVNSKLHARLKPK